MPQRQKDNDSRPYELLVWGATGFTGSLVAEHIAAEYAVRRHFLAGGLLVGCSELFQMLGNDISSRAAGPWPAYASIQTTLGLAWG